MGKMGRARTGAECWEGTTAVHLSKAPKNLNLLCISLSLLLISLEMHFISALVKELMKRSLTLENFPTMWILKPPKEHLYFTLKSMNLYLVYP